MKKLLKISLAVMLFVGIATSLSSCYKKKDTIAILTFVDAQGDPVNGLEVTIDWAPDATRDGIQQKATTDGSGKCSFNFNELYKSGQAGVFVLDVYVNGTVVGIIRVEQETTVEETYALTP